MTECEVIMVFPLDLQTQFVLVTVPTEKPQNKCS